MRPILGLLAPKPSYKIRSPARVAMLGDSIVQYGSSRLTGSFPISTYYQEGEACQAMWLGANFLYDWWPVSSAVNVRSYTGANQGYQQRTSGDFDPLGLGGRWLTTGAGGPPSLSNTPPTVDTNPVVKYKPDIMVISVGINDSQVTGATGCSQRVIRIAAKCLDIGIVPVVCTLRPVDPAKFSDIASRNGLMDQNDRIRTFASTTPGVILCDFQKAWSDSKGLSWPWYTGTSWAWKWPDSGDVLNYTKDGLHPTNYASYFAGKELSRVLNTLVDPANHLIRDYWGAANLIASEYSTFAAGTAGTLGSSGRVAGTLPTGWAGYLTLNGNLGATGNSTAVCSLVGNSDTGGKSVEIVVSPTGTSVELFSLVLSGAASPPWLGGAGGWAFAWAEVELDAWPFWTAPEVCFTLGNETAKGPDLTTPGQTVTGSIGGARTMWCRTPAIQPYSSQTLATIAVRVGWACQTKGRGPTTTAIGTGIARIKRFALCQVPDPRSAWFYP